MFGSTSTAAASGGGGAAGTKKRERKKGIEGRESGAKGKRGGGERGERARKGTETRGESAKKMRGSRERAPPQRRIFGHAAIVARGRGCADARKEKSTRSTGMKSSARAATVARREKKKEDG